MLTLNDSLYFISRHFKQFSVPRVVITETLLDNRPYYGWNIDFIYEIDDQEVYNDKGLIVIPANITYDLESTILHEYRHHLQFNIHGHWLVPDWQNGHELDYYNHNSVFEKDSRLFEVSLGRLDEFTDEFKTPKVNRYHMLNLPTRSFLSKL